ncbi:MAG: hypothetical protein ACJ8MH_08010 [Povalibacter sp.]
MSRSSHETPRWPEPTEKEEVLRQFESCTLPPSQFSHRQHLALGWRYLRQYGFPQGVVRFHDQLRAYVDAVGATAKYHETITWAYMILMNEELALRSAPDESFESMIERRPDLLDHRTGALSACYPRAQLDTDEPKRVLMLPRQSPSLRP